MVYFMDFYTDGGCRGNGQPGSIGAAAAVLKPKYGKSKSWTRSLPPWPRPTNQRAEITGIILALRAALDRYDDLDTDPRLVVTIYSDSRYAIGCMKEWIYKWTRNGWVNSAGNEVANRDLIQVASELDDQVAELGSVEYVWIPREENELADGLCNDDMDDRY